MSKNIMAFPSDFIGNQGMTLRDYFAGLAMQSLVAAEAHRISAWNERLRISDDPYPEAALEALFSDLSIDAYSAADNMLDRREH